MNLEKLSNLCKMQSGGTPSRSNLEYYEGDIAWAKISDLEKSGDGYIYETEEHISEEALKSINNRFFKEGTLLLAMYESVGKTAITKIDLTTNQAILGINIIDEKLLDIKYLKYWFTTIKEQLLNRAVGAALANISLGIVKDLQIPLPPLPQQQKIAKILDAADALRQNDKALIAKYDELTQALFLDMFGDPISNPKGWGEKLVGELCLNIVDCVNKTAPTVDFVTEYKMIRTPNVRNHSVNLESTRFVTLETFEIWNRRLKPQRNDIVFTREAPVGEAGVILSDDQLMLGQRTMIYRVDESKVNNTYLLFQLMGSDVQRQISNISMGSTVKHLSVPSCKAFKILVPPIALQNQFAERVTIIEQQKAIAQASLVKSEELFNSLEQKAFKGELI